MSEKRFEIKADDVDSSIINITRDGEDFAWFLSDIVTDKQVEKVVDKLNEQQATISALSDSYEKVKNMLSEAIEENELLECKEGVYNVHCLKRDYEQLKEENEQLRKELDSFKPVMFQDIRKGTVILYSKR